MAKVRRIQTNFSAGEIDPLAELRNDTEQYFSGAAELTNVVQQTQGGFIRRDGLEYIDELSSGKTAVRMLDFEFNDEQEYLFVVTSAEIKIYNNDTRALVTTLSSSPVTNITAAMLPDLYWTQSADTMILVHPDLEPISITRTGATTFSATTTTLTNIPTYAFSGVTLLAPTTTATPSATTGSVTVTAGVAAFSPSHEGQFLLINDGVIFITEYVSSTVVKGKVRQELRDTTAAAAGEWQLETGYEPVVSGTRGWFRTCTFYEGRLYFGGTKSRPQTVLGSVVGDFFNFDEGSLLDADAINATINTDQLNAINGLFSGRTLQVFTSGGEFSVPKTSLQEPITPSSIAFVRQTRHGSPKIRPVSVDGATIFYDRKDLREFIYNDVEQSYIAPSLNLLATHILKDVVDIDLRRATSASNANYVYAVNSDGTVSVLNTLRSQSITAWSKWTTQGEFIDVCVVGGEVYFVVKRNINSSDVYYIERLDSTLKLDSAIKQTDTATDTWSNLDHLEGETISGFGDDFVIADVTVSSGSVTTVDEHTETEFGLAYYFTAKTLPVDGVFFGEPITAKRKRLVAVYLRVKNTRNILVNGYRPPLLDVGQAFTTTPFLADEWVKVQLGGYSRSGQVTVTQDIPTEANVLGFVLEIGIG